MKISSPETRGASAGASDWKVSIDEQGRAGTVHYREGNGSISMSWEFGGDDVVAFISFEQDAAWRTRYPWAAERRTEIVRRVAQEVIRQKAPNCRAEIDEQSGWINLREGASPLALSPRDEHLAFRERKAKFVRIIAVVALLLAAAAVGLKLLFSVRAMPGAPVGLFVPTAEQFQGPTHSAKILPC